MSDVRSAVLSVVLLLGAGCGGHGMLIDYRSTATMPPPQPTAKVWLLVKNDRDPARGGQTEQIGTIYNSFRGMYPGPVSYSGRPVNASSPDIVPDTVRAATADALAYAGVAILPGGLTLIATVREYWMDGPNVKHGEIAVAYDLVDPSGSFLWHADARGQASAAMTVGNGLVKMFRAALSELSANACNAFQSQPFQSALRARP